MERHDAYYRQYVQILREELRPATGCTEPIAIAYAAAKARSVLGALPDRVLVEVSGNIIKNVKSVVVPHTAGCGASRQLRRRALWPGTPRPSWRCSPP